MKSLIQILGLLVLSLSLAACGGGGSAAEADSPEIAVVKASVADWNAEDLEAALSHYADDAVVVNLLGTFAGKEKIRSLFESAIDEFTMDCRNYKVSGNTVSYECALLGRSDGKVFGGEKYEVVIENGLIVSDKYVGKFGP
ncbi:MAG: nuclear transport factor 2 family protein [Candidatus Dadabacteria bacterium]|nr:nuclear transport factor 2 family protein [Anaerolineales bacterium]MCL4246405.1 nuclear transport factor 2 family protein [Candidatus Dadabacteria bacterium]